MLLVILLLFVCCVFLSIYVSVGAPDNPVQKFGETIKKDFGWPQGCSDKPNDDSERESRGYFEDLLNLASVHWRQESEELGEDLSITLAEVVVVIN